MTATALFRDMFGGEPDGVWSAPGRVNLIGEHTDYNDGFVLPFAIPQRTRVAARRRDDGVIRVVSTFDRTPVELAVSELATTFPDRRDAVSEWARYPLGVAWALRQEAGADEASGVDLAFASDVPVGAGLSSSAAIEGATAVALDDLWRLGLDRVTLARAGRRAENEAVGAPTGIMDQMATLLGVADAAVFLDCRTLETEVVGLGLHGAGLTVVVIDTGVSHAHSTGGYGERRAACERAAAAAGVAALRDLEPADLDRLRPLVDEVTFRRARHVVTENRRVVETVRTLRDDGPRAIGALLTASHVSMRDDFEISIPELDTAVDAALDAGAIGARMTGGGFGGAAIALVDEEAVDQVAATVLRAFEAAGFAAPRVFTVAPADGAGRDS